MSTLAERYARVKAGIPAHVELIAVSKTRSLEEVQALYDLGHRAFGENYPQELKQKQAALPKDIAWHFIGHLQRSNAKHVVPLSTLIHGVDSERLLDEIEKRAAAEAIVRDVLLQVHIAQEETKHGFDADEVRGLLTGVPPAQRWPHVRLTGLMGMATNTGDDAVVRQEFRGLASLFQEVRAGNAVDPSAFRHLSMGMSGDAPWAIAEGSTMVRIGTAIFGERA
jgi:PLP dependent protein